METIHVKKFGMALGITLGLLYLGCVLVMAAAGKDNSVLFFNSLLHGVDVSSVIRMNVPLTEMIMGVIETVILGWLTGATVAAIYNFCGKSN